MVAAVVVAAVVVVVMVGYVVVVMVGYVVVVMVGICGGGDGGRAVGENNRRRWLFFLTLCVLRSVLSDPLFDSNESPATFPSDKTLGKPLLSLKSQHFLDYNNCRFPHL